MEQIRELVRFLPSLEDPDFKAGEFHGAEETGEGVFNMPYVAYSKLADEFVQAAYDHGWVLRGFDWPKWAQSREAETLRDDEATLASATSEQLARLLTVVIRQDRFVEGALLDAFESGLILRIVRRAAAILDGGKEVPRT